MKPNLFCPKKKRPDASQSLMLLVLKKRNCPKGASPIGEGEKLSVEAFDSVFVFNLIPLKTSSSEEESELLV